MNFLLTPNTDVCPGFCELIIENWVRVGQFVTDNSIQRMLMGGKRFKVKYLVRQSFLVEDDEVLEDKSAVI
jgi:hypothetical protein